MIVKPVNAGEKTMDEIKEMIKNLDDDTMISIDFTSLGSVILFHNHPSGDTDPSEMDKDTANRLKYCGQILGIEVKDSLIIGKDVSYSFAAAGEKGWDDAETYKIDPESRMLIKEEQPEFCNSGWSKEHNVTKELSKAIQKAYGIDL